MSGESLAWAFAQELQPLPKLVLIWCADAGRTSLRDAWVKRETLHAFCGGNSVDRQDVLDALVLLETNGMFESLERLMPSAGKPR